jgi:hypothetical protein
MFLFWAILFFFLLYFLLRKLKFSPFISERKVYGEKIETRASYKIKWPGLEPPSPEQKRIVELQAKLIGEIISKIKTKNPNISDEELEEKVKSEYEKEKRKYPELASTTLESFKIKSRKEKIK